METAEAKQTPGKRLLQSINALHELEWYGYGPSLSSDEQLIYPPFIIWRFKPILSQEITRKRLEETLQTCVEEYVGSIDWILFRYKQNWVLMTKRMKEIEDSGVFQTDVSAQVGIGERDPIFGKAANHDLVLLVNVIIDGISRM